MTYRMTVVLEYPSERDAPPVSFKTVARDLGEGRVCAVQFSDALRELEVLEHYASEDVRDKAFHASRDYATPQSGRPPDNAREIQP